MISRSEISSHIVNGRDSDSDIRTEVMPSLFFVDPVSHNLIMTVCPGDSDMYCLCTVSISPCSFAALYQVKSAGPELVRFLRV